MRNLIRRIVLLAPLILATVTFAQFGGKAGFGEAFRPDILPRDMTLIVETLIQDSDTNQRLGELISDKINEHRSEDSGEETTEEVAETPVVEAPKANYALNTKKKGFDENEFDELFNK